MSMHVLDSSAKLYFGHAQLVAQQKTVDAAEDQP
jgi:hypothetical protein